MVTDIEKRIVAYDELKEGGVFMKDGDDDGGECSLQRSRLYPTRALGQTRSGLGRAWSDGRTMSSTQSEAQAKSSNSSIVHVPPITASHPLLRSLPPMTQLPADLLDLLNQAYFLHLLANDPSKVLPAGKSLLSVMSSPHVMRRGDDEPPTLQEKVEEMVHKAFWDEVPPPS